MADATALHDSLRSIAERADDDMSERDAENLFLEQGFYDALDYEGTGTDLRSEFTLPDDRRPDYITLDTNEAVTAVYEFKTTGRNLLSHEDQLFHYCERWLLMNATDLLERFERWHGLNGPWRIQSSG